ncbi:MAG TPA: hypothetical protein VNG71_19200 [Pyrinomonadaceae bacterium]|nr:hypothetical protein [Pyrinomonadaceae bacterium]
MATKKKAAKKKAAKKTAGAKKSIVILPPLRFDPRIKGDPPPPWLRQLDLVRQRELQAWVNAIVNKIGR